ncbi:MAG: LptE family protein [Bacteroidales bacterium]|nr:LptE family protein [Bacteroidales bacterium]
MKKPFYTYLFILIILLSFSSCGIYSFTGASISPEVKTISIKYFPNQAPLVQATLSQVFTDALKDKFISQTNLTLVPDDGDLNIEGEITDYSTKPIAITGDQTAALNRLTITVKVKFTNKFDETQNFETTFSRYEDYESTKNLSDVEDVLIEQINSYLIEDIFNKAVVNW